MQPPEYLIIFLVAMVANGQNEKCRIEFWESDKWMIKCENLTTLSDGNYAAQFIKNSVNIARIDMIRGDTAVLPADIFATTKITYLHFDYYRMTDIPHEHINSVCATLNMLWIQNSEISSGTIRATKLRNCKQLNLLSIFNSGITKILPNAFQGLDNLQKLYLDDNKLASLTKESFRGLNKLVDLNLMNNNLEILEEGTFDPIGNTIESFYLFGNPLHCNCSIKWLQDWVKAIERNKPHLSTEFIINCVGPQDVDFLLMPLYDCIPTMPPITTPTTPTTTPVCTECKPEDVVSKLSELLTALLEDAACDSLQEKSDEDVMSKLNSALEVKKSIVLYKSKFGKTQTSAQTQRLPSGDCKPTVAELSELLTALLEEASSYPMLKYSDEDILAKLNSALEISKSELSKDLICGNKP